jgi:hypothetical protein
VKLFIFLRWLLFQASDASHHLEWTLTFWLLLVEVHSILELNFFPGVLYLFLLPIFLIVVLGVHCDIYKSTSNISPFSFISPSPIPGIILEL